MVRLRIEEDLDSLRDCHSGLGMRDLSGRQ